MAIPRIVAFLSFLVLCLSAAASAFGTIITFNNQAAFLATGLVVSTETFDEFPPLTVFNQSSVLIDSVLYSSSNSQTQWIAGIHNGNSAGISAPNDFGPSEIGTDTLISSTDAIGFFLTASEGVGLTEPIQITVTASNGEQLVETVFITGTGVLPQALYAGFVASQGIESVSIVALPDQIGQKANFGFDNVSRGALIPDSSSTLALFGIGVVSMLIPARSVSRRQQF